MLISCFAVQAGTVFSGGDIHLKHEGGTALVKRGVGLESAASGSELSVSVRLWADSEGLLYLREGAEFPVGKLLGNSAVLKGAYIDFKSVVKAEKVFGTKKEAMKSLDCLYVERCGTCHRVFEPDHYDSAHWDRIMRSMKVQAGVTDEEYGDILYYLNMVISEPPK